MLDAYGIPIATTAGRVKVTKFTASGTYQQSTQLLYIWVRLVGGGGGGNTASGSPGGGGGGYTEKWLSQSQIGNPVTVTVGSGGAKGNPASNGTASSFAAASGTLTGDGGAGSGVGGGGAGSGGDLNIAGGAGTTDVGGATHLGAASDLYGGGGNFNVAGQNGVVLVYEFLGS